MRLGHVRDNVLLLAQMSCVHMAAKRQLVIAVKMNWRGRLKPYFLS